MNFSLVYLAQRFFYRIIAFLEHWYVGAFHAVFHGVREIITGMDQTLALRATLKNLGRPLFGDYTPLGRVLGFVFRPVRVAVAAALYLTVMIIGVVMYAAWAAVPVAIIFNGLIL